MLRLRRIAPPDPISLTVIGGADTFVVGLKRLRSARRMTLRVSTATGAVVLTLPSRVTLDAAQAFVDTQVGWIAARLARVPARVSFQAGAIVPVRGVPHRIDSRPGGRSATRLSVDPEGAAIIAVSGADATVPGRVRRFLVSEASADLQDAVSRHSAALGLEPTRVTIRDTRSRWGSCSSTGALSFSWRMILAPPLVLDYLAAHECAHLKELNHSRRFWKILTDLCPATEEAERWLKRHGTDLHRYG